jgi:hypothetical protein
MLCYALIAVVSAALVAALALPTQNETPSERGF